MQAVILAGGKGERLLPLTKNKPKPLVIVNNKPFIYYILKQLDNFKISQVIIIAGYKSRKFKSFIKKYKTEFKIDIKIVYQPERWDTGKRIFKIKKILNSNFMILYGDNLVMIQKKIVSKLKINSVIIQQKNIAREKGNVKLKKNKIFDYDEKREKNYKYVELGYFYLRKKDVFKFLSNTNHSFSKTIYQIVKRNLLSFFITRSNYLSITNVKNLKLSEKKIKKS